MINGPKPTNSAGPTQFSGSGQAGQSAEGADASQVWRQFQSRFGAKPEKPREIKKTLDKDDFMRIMVTQMQHQDPTKPFNAEQMAGQMAQYASVEQLKNLNNRFDQLQKEHYQPMERMMMTGIIGKTVTIDRERFFYEANSNAQIPFDLPKDAKEVTARVINDRGDVILQKDLGSLSQGPQLFTWDGRSEAGMPSKSGTHILRVEAKGDRGELIPLQPRAQAQVTGIGFDAGEPVFIVGTGAGQQKILMRHIVSIEEPNLTAAAQARAAQVLQQQTEAPRPAPAHSAKSSAPQVSLQQALSQTARSQEKGFPNGLNDDAALENSSQLDQTQKKGGER